MKKLIRQFKYQTYVKCIRDIGCISLTMIYLSMLITVKYLTQLSYLLRILTGGGHEFKAY